MRPFRLVLLAATALVGACSSEAPFVDLPLSERLDKPQPLSKSGTVTVCYGDAASPGEVERLAVDACGAYGLQARLYQADRYQCRVTAPHRSIYQCYLPDLTTASGGYINPLDEQAVKAWEERTGKKRPPSLGQRVLTPGDGLPVSPPPVPAVPPEPAPAQVTPVPPAPPVSPKAPTPADVNPPRPVPPQPEMPPPPPPAPVGEGAGFNLPVGSWGDAFKE